MLSNILVNALADDPSLGLTKAVTLFAENGQGDQFVLIRTFSPQPWAVELKDNREASVQVLVKGWSYDDGSALAERIVAAIVAMEGGTYAYKTESYDVQSIVLKKAPFGFRDGNDVLYFSADFRVYYYLAIA
jgi:hypothetical protein